MNLKEKIRTDMITATKSRQENVKNVLKVVLGDISTLEARSGKESPDEEVCKVIKKTLEGIQEMLKYKSADPGLMLERDTLTALLPNQLGQSEVLAALIDKTEEIKSAKSDGQATGIAMKFFKEKKLAVDGKDVTEVVKKIRS